MFADESAIAEALCQPSGERGVILLKTLVIFNSFQIRVTVMHGSENACRRPEVVQKRRAEKHGTTSGVANQRNHSSSRSGCGTNAFGRAAAQAASGLAVAHPYLQEWAQRSPCEHQ